MARPCAFRSAALDGWTPRAVPASPLPPLPYPHPERGGSIFLSTRWSRRTTAQAVASWVSSGSWIGTQSYTLANAWTYATGTYSTTLTYTLSAP